MWSVNHSELSLGLNNLSENTNLDSLSLKETVCLFYYRRILSLWIIYLLQYSNTTVTIAILSIVVPPAIR